MYNIEFQLQVLNLLCTNMRFYTDFQPLLRSEYFEVPEHRILFKLISDYIKNYNREIELSGFLILIDDYVNSIGYDEKTYKLMKDGAKSVMTVTLKSEQFVVDQLLKFARRQGLKTAILKSIDILEKDGNYDQVLKEVDQAVSIGGGLGDYGLTFEDLMKFPELYRKKYEGTNLIKTGFPGIDRALGGGLAPGEVHVVMAPPKCFLGTTRVRLLNGEVIPISEFESRGSEWVYSYNTEKQSCYPALAHYAGKRITESLVEVKLDNGEKIGCTSDHKWMLDSGTYREAIHLSSGDTLKSLNWKRQGGVSDTLDLENISVTKVVSVTNVPGQFEVFDISVPGNNNFCIDTTSNGKNHPSGVIVHNSGKTTFGANVGAWNISQQKTVYHISLEIKSLDMLAKYATRMSGFTYGEIVNITDNTYHEKMSRFLKYSPNLFIQYFTEGSVNCLDLRAWVSRQRNRSDKDPDLIIVDYDDCLVSVSGNREMYEGAGEIYTDLVALADYYKCPILTFAQPRRDAWDKPDRNELIMAYELAHSAKKAHKAYSISSLNFARGSQNGIFYTDMVRRGESGCKIPLSRDLSRSLFSEVRAD